MQLEKCTSPLEIFSNSKHRQLASREVICRKEEVKRKKVFSLAYERSKPSFFSFHNFNVNQTSLKSE
jgi:hypothetical protein